ncbi:MAG TPA: alpha/beta fold hydrolase, partial [Chthoniobacteraceae bacterium]|nr:alpha/beta fold hydrolase [Chthoniobacteraceae bacterium]
MPVIPSSFKAPWYLANGHVQTILPVLLPRRFQHAPIRERLELQDGDFLELDWSRRGHRRVAVITHGLEGSTNGGYIRGMASAMNEAGWDAMAWNFRGCGAELNRLLRFYHSGETGDLRQIIAHIVNDYESISLIGFSLGGNITLKYLGEAPPDQKIVAAAAVSVPVDLASSARILDERLSNRLYLRRFLQSLITKVEAKARHFPEELNVDGIRTIRSFQEFDNRYTAPMHGFRDAIEYWERASSKPHLGRIGVRTLLLSARNDPFLTPECFPVEAATSNTNLYLEAPESGGHVGFLDLANGLKPWSERR